MDERLAVVVAGLRETFPEVLDEPSFDRGETSIDVPRERLVDVATHLRDDGPFEMLADLSGVDFLDVNPAERRFLVALHLLSLRGNRRVRLRVWVPDGDARCPSVSGVWPGADWLEREVYDMFGIVFEGHPGLSRILMPDDWEGFPQRKDYPLGGTEVEYKGATVPAPDLRRPPQATTGYPGRLR